MSFLVLPTEIIINNILTLFSINDLIEFSKICRSTNKYVFIYLKCNNCNTKIQKNEDIYNFEICHECNILICKKCQSKCHNCLDTYCDNCLVTEECYECEEYLNNSSSDEDY